VEYRLLGPLEVVADDGRPVELRGAKLRGLLAVLALDAGRVVPAERLVDALYGEDLPSRSANAVQQLVSKVRRALADAGGDPGVLVTRPHGYLLDAPREAVDVLRFERLLAEGRAATAAGDLASAARLLSEALALWRGSALVDVAVDGPVPAERTRLEELRLVAVEDRVDVELRRGQHDVLVAELEAMVRAEPLRERRWGQLMVALYRSGRQGEALRAYQQARRVLGDELGIEPGPELRRLEAAVLAQDAALAAPPVASSPAVPPPAQADGAVGGDDGAAVDVREWFGPRTARVRRPLTTCIGREVERSRLEELIGSARLVTLVGAGGSGKTRLATEVALAVEDRFEDGVAWVELAPIGPGGVAVGVNRALGLDESAAARGLDDAASVVDSLLTALQRRRTGLVLDNCEHVIDEVAVLVEVVLERAPDVRVLATSREGLGIPGEVLFPVPPLPLTDAVELFVQRTAAAGVALQPDELAADGPVEEICRRLDGLPLAVELATARVRHLGVAELAARLDQRLDVLTAGPRTVQARQRTLRAVVDWSYELLDDTERRVFERLGVFAGGATLAAARRVCAGDGVAEADVEGALSRLVDKSLVGLDRRGGTARYRLLQTLAEYALERLAARGEEPQARRRHLAWLRALAAGVEFDADVADRRAAMVAVDAEDAEVRHALTWALVDDPVSALDLAAALAYFWCGTLQARTGWAFLNAALAAAPDAPGDVRATAQAYAGLAGGMCGAPEAPGLAEAAAEYERRRGDDRRIGIATSLRACTLTLRFEPREALVWLDEAREHYGRAGDTLGLAFTAHWTGYASLMLGDLERAQAELAASVPVFRARGDFVGVVASLVLTADLAERSGRLDDAAAAYEELRDYATGGPATMALAHLAALRRSMGRLDEARDLADQAVAGSQDGFSPVIAALAHKARGFVHLDDGEPAAAGADLTRAALFFQDAGQLRVVAECWLGVSTAREQEGDAGAARSAAVAALDAARRGGADELTEQATERLAGLGGEGTIDLDRAAAAPPARQPAS
jgi:predicted ATPase/DNA-binding SARP family transcriptional activator